VPVRARLNELTSSRQGVKRLHAETIRGHDITLHSSVVSRAIHIVRNALQFLCNNFRFSITLERMQLLQNCMHETDLRISGGRVIKHQRQRAYTATYMPVKFIQFIYTMHNKILTIGSSTLKYKIMT